jgi:hypothetical protein
VSDQDSITAPNARDHRVAARDRVIDALRFGLYGRKGLTPGQKLGRIEFAKAELSKALASLESASVLIVEANEGVVVEPFSLDAPDPADIVEIEALDSAADEAANDDPDSGSYEADGPDEG